MTIEVPFPYLSVPREARWREVVAGRKPRMIDPHLGTKLRINPADKLASAGSCFAQRITSALQSSGFNYMLCEVGAPFLTSEERSRLAYGLYSARYGNIYTVLQLLQLFRRAFGLFDPVEPVWRLNTGAYVDPFRPAIQAGGFSSESECLWDRQMHLKAVRRMFEELNVFIFTLGLTEAWVSKNDGAVFPACPGSPLGGSYDPENHLYHNFSAAEVSGQLEDFISALRQVNPSAQIILTVSPVPLLATFEPRHVLQATVYSKSVLRVACEEVVRRHDHVHYFASYEIVTSTGDSHQYFMGDGRTVTAAAVEHVIECFHRQFTGHVPASSPGAQPETEIVAAPVSPLCDEELVMAALADHAAAGEINNEH